MEHNKLLPNIRLRKITLTNFRNIVHTEVDIPGGKINEFKDGESSVLGLYGQNGAGKTSLLMAINALKTALSGFPFTYKDFSSCIRSGCDKARLEFELSAYNERGDQFDLYYAFSIGIDNREPVLKDNPQYENDIISESDIDEMFDMVGLGGVISKKGKDDLAEYLLPKEKRIIIFDELLQYAALSTNGIKKNKQILIDTSAEACKISGTVFGNKKKYEQFTKNLESDELLYEEKINSFNKSSSFIFSPKTVYTLIKGSVLVSYKIILKSLHEFGRNYLFVVLTDTTGYNNINMLPLFFWRDSLEEGAFGMMYPVPLFGEHCTILEEYFPMVKAAMESTKMVMSKIIPGLLIEIEDIGKTVSENGTDVHLFDLITIRNSVRIPLAYESDGIRRIVSFMSLLIAAYNNPSITVAIDEIESGIFEYMLGELLSIMNNSAKGQLIFTSHNLRPLEVLPHKNLLFTTVNPENRFTKLEGVSGNNNLRDSYFRSIILGGGKDAFYDATDTFNIEQALIEAGMVSEN